MNEADIFIGREHELQMIDDMVTDASKTRHFLPIIGPGGVGKTWLLREVSRRYAADDRVVVVRIDYAETRFQSASALYLHVLEQFDHLLSAEQRQMYRKKLSEWERFAGYGFDPDWVRKEEDDVYQLGNDLVNHISEEKRILILIDTLEALRVFEPIADRLNAFFGNFHNAVIIIAGRPEAELWKYTDKSPNFYQGWTLHPGYVLQTFSPEETVRYLLEMLPVRVPDELCEKITFLTDGNPVLVAIASEWLKRHVDLPEDVDLSLEELKALPPQTLAQRRKRFEFELVDKVRTLGEDIDWAVLYLAYLDRRYDRRILQLALEIDHDDRLDAIIRELHTLVFVRKSMATEGGLLHDEAKRLFREHAWPVVDPGGKIRRSLARTVVDNYYIPEIERLDAVVQKKIPTDVAQKAVVAEYDQGQLIPDEEWLRREMQIECLDYSIRISRDEGWKYFRDCFGEALERQMVSQIDALIQTVHTIAYDWFETTWFKVRVAQGHLAKGDLPTAIALAQGALQDPAISSEDAIRALDVLSGSTSEPSEQIRLLEEALGRARNISNVVWMARIHSYLGLAHRRQGNWKKAEESYKQALRSLDQKQDPNQYANTLNNLAFVRMLKGDLDGADNVADRALKIRQQENNSYGLALSYSTKARIAEEKGRYADAQRYYHMSVNLFQSLDKFDEAASRKISLAASARSQRNFEEAHQLLEDGLSSKNDSVRGVALYHQSKVFRDEAKSLQEQKSEPERIVALYQQSQTVGDEALQYAQKVQDAYLEARILLDMAVNTMLHQKRADEVHMARLQDILKQYNFLREEGRLVELRGDLSYVQGDVRTAFEYYIQACSKLFEHSKTVFDQTFSRIRSKFLDLSLHRQQDICQMVEENIALSDSHSPALAALKQLCDDALEMFEETR